MGKVIDMGFIDEKGKLTRNAFVTYIFLMMLPFLVEFIFFVFNYNEITYDYRSSFGQMILIEIWGIAILSFVGFWMKRREELWKKRRKRRYEIKDDNCD